MVVFTVGLTVHCEIGLPVNNNAALIKNANVETYLEH